MLDRKGIENRFWASINDALSADGARLADDAKRYLDQAVKIGAQETDRLTGPRLEGAIDFGVESYKELIGEAVGKAREYGDFPEIGFNALVEAMRSVGNRAPYWM